MQRVLYGCRDETRYKNIAKFGVCTAISGEASWLWPTVDVCVCVCVNVWRLNRERETRVAAWQPINAWSLAVGDMPRLLVSRASSENYTGVRCEADRNDQRLEETIGTTACRPRVWRCAKHRGIMSD